MQDLHSKYERLLDNALRAYGNCKDKDFKKFWLKVYETLENNRMRSIRLEEIPRRMN